LVPVCLGSIPTESPDYTPTSRCSNWDGSTLPATFTIVHRAPAWLIPQAGMLFGLSGRAEREPRPLKPNSIPIGLPFLGVKLTYGGRHGNDVNDLSGHSAVYIPLTAQP
jgi:hypothetical protein